MKKILIVAVMALISVAASAQKFAHVNYGELVQLTPAADSARASLAAAQKEAEETLQSMMDEYQSKYQQYQQKVSTWTAAIKESKEKELMEIENRIKETQQSISGELQQMQNQLMAPIVDKVQKTVEKLAKSGGYIYVFDVSSLLYFDAGQSKDLTPDARKALSIPADRTLESLQAEMQAQQQAQQ